MGRNEGLGGVWRPFTVKQLRSSRQPFSEHATGPRELTGPFPDPRSCLCEKALPGSTTGRGMQSRGQKTGPPSIPKHEALSTGWV